MKRIRWPWDLLFRDGCLDTEEHVDAGGLVGTGTGELVTAGTAGTGELVTA